MKSLPFRPPSPDASAQEIDPSRGSLRSVRKFSGLALGLFFLSVSISPTTAQTTPPTTTRHRKPTLPKTAPRPVLPTSRATQHNQAAPHAPPSFTFLNPLRGGYPYVQSVAFSDRGDRVIVGAAGKDGGVRSWSWWSGIEQEFASPYGDIVQVSFLQKESFFGAWRVYTPGDGLNGNQFTIHKIGQKDPILSGEYGTSFATFSHSAPQTALVGGWSKIAFFASGKTQGSLPNKAERPDTTAITLSSNGRYAAISQRNATKDIKKYHDEILWIDTFKKKILTTTIRPFSYPLERLALTNDGHLAIATRGYAEIWDLKREKRLLGIDQQGFPELLPLYSPDQKTFLLISQASIGQSWTYARTPSGFNFANPSNHKDTKIFFYDANTYKIQKIWTIQQCLFRTTYFRFGSIRGPEHNPERVAFSPDGRVIAIGCNGGVLFFDRSLNQQIKGIPWIVRRPLQQQPPKP